MIANINDGSALKAIATELEGSADKLASLGVTAEDLVRLRAGYVEASRGRGSALRATADAAADADKKRHLHGYQEHTSRIGAIISEINEACGATAPE